MTPPKKPLELTRQGGAKPDCRPVPDSVPIPAGEEDREEGLEEEFEEEIEEDLEDDREDDEDEAAESPVDPKVLAGWCRRCRGACCRYYTVILSEPEDADDFDELRWFLAHEGNYVYIDEGQWHLDVVSRCRFLADDGRCLIYDRRPDVCRDFGREEECEFTGEFDFDRFFKTIPELEAYAREVLDPGEFARLTVFPEGWEGPVQPGLSAGDCEVIRGDSVRHRVRWSRATLAQAEQPLRLRFLLRNAKLYAFRVEE